MTNALENTLQRLQRSFEQQRTFVSDSAHELKTAVAVVKSSLQLLELKERTPAEYHAGLERTLTDTQRLEELVAKMLTLARVESGPSEADRPQAGVSASCDIAECVRGTIAQLRTVAALHAVDVVVQSTDDSRVPLAADDCAIVIENLLMNALQHSPRNAKVYLTLRSENATIELTVADQGEGIDPSALPHIFDRFYRGDPSRARSTGGAGLGLAICKAVVERAGGTIELKSEPGKGTTAIVRLPKA
jgi:signal transduction histidine kinase